MKLTKVFAALAIASMLMAAGPKQPTPVAFTCLAGSPFDINGNPIPDTCNAGQIQFSGSNYGHLVEIFDNGSSLGQYRTAAGSLDVTFTYSTADLGGHTLTVVAASGKSAGNVLDSVNFTVVAGS